MPYYCTVPQCTSMAGKAKNVSFHQFPRDVELAELWNQVLKRGKPYTKYSKVCSLHFKPEDYTLTQKSRGQWRTLRKDAIPSQNLPSELPTDDWHRKNKCPLMLPMDIDTTLQHQMAQTIYVQTMLAMQAAGINESNGLNHDQPFPSNSEPTSQNEDDASTSSQEREQKKIVPLEKVTYKCNQCSKCFKDPDVFILHQRNHVKTENNAEMLRANPILANLLKTDSENNKNVISIENQIMSALTENMANYLQNLSTTMTSNSSTDDEFVGIDKQYENSIIMEDSNNQGEKMCEPIRCDCKENDIEKNKPTIVQQTISEAIYNFEDSNKIEDVLECTPNNNKSIKLDEVNNKNIQNSINKENEHRNDSEAL